MSDKPKQVVWILGAGFSRSLGGPLFGTLFGPWSMANLKAHFPPAEFPRLFGDASDVVHWVYNYGRQFSLGRALAWDRERGETGEELWQDAEEYLQILDVAASDPRSPWATRINRIVHTHLNRVQGPEGAQPSLVEINGAARRLLAAECSAFTKVLDLQSEPATQYVTWARRLGPEHTIITFNYDRLLELLGAKTGKLACVPQGWDRDGSVASVYKLHGSVDWVSEDVGKPQRVIKVSSDPFAALTCDSPTKVVIANPGPTKSVLTDTLEEQWTAAFKAILFADAVVFVGYRFPPTDARAQQTLLHALRNNKSQYLAVHIVLGPNTASLDCIRLRQLLALTLADRKELQFGEKLHFKSRNLRAWALGAADFLGQAEIEHITEPFKFADFP